MGVASSPAGLSPASSGLVGSTSGVGVASSPAGLSSGAGDSGLSPASSGLVGSTSGVVGSVGAESFLKSAGLSEVDAT